MLFVWESFPVLHVILRFNVNHQICFLFFSCTFLSQIPHTSGHTKCDENRNSGPDFFLCLSKVHPCTQRAKQRHAHTSVCVMYFLYTRICMCVNVLLLRTATYSHVYTQKDDTTTATCKYTYTTRWRLSWCVCTRRMYVPMYLSVSLCVRHCEIFSLYEINDYFANKQTNYGVITN